MLNYIQAEGVCQWEYFFSGPTLFEGAIPVPQNYFIPFLLPLPALLTFVKVAWITLWLDRAAANKDVHYDETEELWYGQMTPQDCNLSWAHQLVLETISF